MPKSTKTPKPNLVARFIQVNIYGIFLFTLLWGFMGTTTSGFWEWRPAIFAGILTTIFIDAVALIRIFL